MIALICPMQPGERDAETYAELANRLAAAREEAERGGRVKWKKKRKNKKLPFLRGKRQNWERNCGN